MIDADNELLRCGSTLLRPLLRVFSHFGANFFALPALSSLPSHSRYAGLKLSLLLDESEIFNNAFGMVSYMLPMEVYLQKESISSQAI